MKLILEDLAGVTVHFSATQMNFFTENCIVALEHNSHKSVCEMELSGDQSEILELTWSTVVNKNGYVEQKKFTEKGAEAISFLIATHYTEFEVIREANIGTGIDYWLGFKDSHKNYDPDNFLNARLEISGILTESGSNKVKYRVAQKADQTKATDGTGLPAFVSIVEFSTPKAYFAKK